MRNSKFSRLVESLTFDNYFFFRDIFFPVNHLIVSSIALILISCSTIVNSYYAFPNLMNTVSTDSKWYGVDYDWPGSTSRALLKSSGKFASKNNIATRAAIYRDSTFLAFPRFRSGIPATLVRAKLKRGSCSPTFEPFPCWAMQEESKCSAIQSAVDITLDASDILWVLDSGAINTLEKEPVQTCSPKVLAFNVKNGKLVKTITFEGLINKNSRLQYLAVDYGRDGRAFVYVSDAASRALIIYDVQASKGYRIILPKSVSEGCKKKDVLYLALTQKPNAPGVLYFTYLCSNKMFSIKTEYLRDARTSGKIEGN